MREGRRIRNLGILAHADAGKTTLTETMLYLSGSIRSVGSVDRGTTVSDGLEVERRRGISVRASVLPFAWKGVQINLIDNPGHADFSAEVERSLRVLDGAVLMLSAVEGIQAQTEALWEALEAVGLPVILHINKIDRTGADSAGVLESLRKAFSRDVLPLNRPEREGGADVAVTSLVHDRNREFIEAVAGKDDALLDSYLNAGNPGLETLHAALARCVRGRKLFPLLHGAAKYNVGTEGLLDAIVACLPDADTDCDQPVSGLVFRIDHDRKLGRVAGVRLYAGRLRNRDTVLNTTAGREEKVSQIKRRSLTRYEDTGVLEAGDIGFLCGMPDVRIGDVFGDPGRVPGQYTLMEPLLSVQVRPENEGDYVRLAEALQQLSSEDPHLGFRWFHEERELQVRVAGAVQTEILAEALKSRFDIEAVLSDPTVIYRETPARPGYGADSYTMPKPCWAIVKFLLEPAARGSGVSYRSEVRTNDIKQKYQNEIASAIPEALTQGIKGWEVTDLKITLTEGSDHVLHSRPGDFKLAMNIAIMKGLTETGTTLLEPILAFRISASEAFLGKVMADVTAMRGSFQPAETADGRFVLGGRFPLASSLDYPIRLSALTGGKAKLAVRLEGYEACPDHLGAVREYKGISPLDRAKYILKMRGAITASATA